MHSVHHDNEHIVLEMARLTREALSRAVARINALNARTSFMTDAEEALCRVALDLYDGLSDMIAGGRLKEADIPDDWAWLVAKLCAVAELAQQVDLDGDE